MKRLKHAISSYFSDEKKKPSSERAYIIQTICDDFFTQKDFQKVLMQTSEMTLDEIREIYDKAKSWKTNPPALFWKLVKEKRSDIAIEKKKKANEEA